ncbi:MAG TPA: FAD-dependent oxidoreductase [Opitutales bacterium]|nr:FAD-dependent oxidoreductase [Opitutales bacterium]
MNPQKSDVVVLGAGIIGTSVARQLQEQGRQVTLIDKGPIGYGCSYGNAGWITPCFATPLPQPGMLLKAIKWMFDPESPLYIQPHLDFGLLKWLLQFASNMNKKQENRSIKVLTAISLNSLEFYRAIAKRHPETAFEKTGLLNICETDDSLRGMIGEMEMMAEHGIEGKIMSAAEINEFEPSVREDKIKGGVYYPNECHAEPLAMVQAIYKEFIDLGGTFVPNCEVYDFETENRRITKIKTTRGNMEADLVVWALGSWSEEMGKRLRLRLPVRGGKGYAMIVNDTEFGENDIKPKHSIMIVDRKIAVTPRANSLRLAGTLELVKNDMSIAPRRVNAILKGSKEFLHIPKEFPLHEVWRGLRPCTPDGVPMIGFSKKWDNLFINTGHQLLGLQAAPGSAKLSGQLIANETPYVDSAPFIPDRF